MTTPAILYDYIPSKEEESPDFNLWHESAPEECEEFLDTIFSDTCWLDYVFVNADEFTTSGLVENPNEENKTPNDSKSNVKNLLHSLFLQTNWFWPLKTAKDANRIPSKKISLESNSPPIRNSNIFSSYDWVSNVIIDEEGSRLILPGQLVNLTSSPTNNDEIPQDSISMFGTSTIMVSAHDLLATTRTQKSSFTDFDFDYRSSDAMTSSSLSLPPIMPPLTTTMENFPKVLMRLARTKASRWIQTTRGSLNQSISSISKNIAIFERRHRLLAMTSNLIMNSLEWCFPDNNEDAPEPDRNSLELARMRQEGIVIVNSLMIPYN